jgi:hypothetical protein
MSAEKSVQQQQRPSDNPASFTDYFKTYVNGWVAAAIALPTAITWKGIPIYESQRSILTTYTALSCVLILAYLFYSRAIFMVRLKSRIGSLGLLILPLVLICATAFCGYKYYELLMESVRYTPTTLQLGQALSSLQMNEIHDGPSIIAYYILTMVFAESALFLMAFREWRR